MIPVGQRFYKMNGSGNDFVMLDARACDMARMTNPETVRRICARGTGVGADGIVTLGPLRSGNVQLIYWNADGSRAEFCGNATLCTARLAVELGLARADGMTIETDSGLVIARVPGSRPEIDLPAIDELRPAFLDVGPPADGERRIGFARVGVPHLVVEVDDVELQDVSARGRELRRHPSLSDGANVNFVSAAGPRWRIRTYERGVESETLACGSGSVATAAMLAIWKRAPEPVRLETRSERVMEVRFRRENAAWFPTLSGEAVIAYQGTLAELF